MANDYCVYMHTLPNGKVYIGLTSREPEERWQGGRGYKRNHAFFTEILYYGWANIKHEILFSGLTKAQADTEEKRLIKLYKSDQIEYGYNLQTGGVEGFTHGETTREKISEASKKMWANPEQRQKLIDIQKKIQSNPEIKKRKSEWSKNRYHTDDAYRKKFLAAQDRYRNSEEGKRKTQARAKEMWAKPGFKEEWHRKMSGANNPSARPVRQFTLDGKFIREYSTGKEASEITGATRSGIAACARGRFKTSGGFVWKYADEEKEPAV